MSNKLTAGDAVQIIESAFAPLKCVAHPWDYNHRIRFRVYDTCGDLVLSVEELLKSQFVNPNRLESIINQARSTLAEKGISINAWTFPHP